MICTSCGKDNSEGTLFCTKCGANIGTKEVLSGSDTGVTYSPRRKTIFILAIVGAVLSSTFGFAFSLVAWMIGNQEIKNHPKDWMVKIGRIFGKIFTFVSIANTIFFIVYLFYAIPMLIRTYENLLRLM